MGFDYSRKNKRWQLLRARVLREQRWCQEERRYGLNVPAEIVHHVWPAEDFPEYAYCTWNLISLSSDGKGEILVSLLEESRFTGLQFDLILPDGVTLAENGARSESSRHGCWYARHEDGSYAILCSSMSNAELHEGPVLRLRTDAKADGTASVCNVVLSDIYSTRHEAAPAETFMEDATAIAGVTGDGLTVRTGHGTLSLLSGQDRTVTVYGVGGMVITETDLVAGKANTIKLPAGVYIVNNRKVTVR